MSHGYGWKPSLPDARDHYHHLGGAPVAESVDLRTTGDLPSVWDQGQLGSCVSHGVDAAYAFDLAAQGIAHDWSGSRLFLYYNGRRHQVAESLRHARGVRLAVRRRAVHRSPADQGV